MVSVLCSWERFTDQVLPPEGAEASGAGRGTASPVAMVSGVVLRDRVLRERASTSGPGLGCCVPRPVGRACTRFVARGAPLGGGTP
eukprot:7045360-Heterocapsa_arctica.AAC.1